jgi:Mesyanzhinovviridae DNA primase
LRRIGTILEVMSEPSAAAALGFLRKMYPEGPWALTAIRPDRKGIQTTTFYPKDSGAASDWLNDRIGQVNLYFHTNPVLGSVDKKAERTDIASVNYLHVDLDPAPTPQGADPGEWLRLERSRCLRLLVANRPASIPEPTVIVDSGGGYQAFWKLREPIPVNGELGLAEAAARYNKQLEIILGGDNCFNIDRLMRLPGTVNLPNAKKAAKGRKPAKTRVLHFKEGLAYPLSDFTPAPAIAANADGKEFAGKTIYPQCRVEIGANVRRLESIDELDEWDVPERIKIICMQGRHPEQPKSKDNSRSAWVFDAVCGLVRCSVPDEVIYSILTDPECGISDSILEWRGRAGAYAVRQIEQAKELAIDPTLRELNNTYAVVSNLGGKCRIIERVKDPMMKRYRITKQSFEDFRNANMHIQVQCGTDKDGKPKFIAKGKWWLQHPLRRQYKSLVFSPELTVEDGYNLWQGFAVEPAPGDCSVLLDHLRRNVCADVPDHYDYLLNWMARAVQMPYCPGEVAVVLRGARGVGKSMIAKVFGFLWGSHYMVVSNSSHLVGNFNAHLRDTCFLFADEAFFAGDKKHRSVLNSLITDDMLPLEAKGVDVEMGQNCLHVMMASNERHVVPAGEDERRYFVLDVTKGNHQDSEFFGRLLDQLRADDNAGYRAFLHELRTRDISKFNVRNVPKTEALQEQKILSLSHEEEWWYGKLMDGYILPDHSEWETMVPKDYIVRDYARRAQLFQLSNRGNATRLGRFLANVIPGLATTQARVQLQEETPDGQYVLGEPRRYHHYRFPDLATCRKAWVDKYGHQEWPEPLRVENEPEDGGLPF